jgi:hypothetical protein
MIRVLASLLSLWTVTAGSLEGHGEVLIVKNCEPKASILISAEETPHLLEAGRLLADYISRSTGARLPILRVPTAVGETVIQLGRRSLARDWSIDLAGLANDGFVIAFPEPRSVVIVGPTEWGVEFGVCEFLERYLGVRWLMPGEFGDDIPKHRTLIVPAQEVRQNPAFICRDIGSNELVARRNRSRGWIVHGHNLDALFPPSRYARTYPEFFPILNGQRYLPARDQDSYTWQPCFSARGIAQEAVKTIRAYFRSHPDQKSFSLAMNDNNRFCECGQCLKARGGRTNFLGYADYSDSYFAWANRVVNGVLEVFPDKWFGTYAYMGLAEPPLSVARLNPRLVVYLTYDRHKWIEKEIRFHGQLLTEAWNRTGATLGWYEYNYGYPYLLPRVWFHQMAENLRFAHQHGVRAYVSELFYNWGEGPKMYLTLKLLWNPEADVDALFQEWCVRAVGEQAAPDLMAYYRHWEDFWTRRVLRSAWFVREGMWLPFERRGYLDVVTDQDMELSRKWMEAVVGKAGSIEQKERAKILFRAFEFYEASVRSSVPEMRAATSSPGTEDEAVRRLDSAAEYMSWKKTRYKIIRELDEDPILHDPMRRQGLIYRELIGDRWGCFPLWQVYEWAAKAHGQVRRRLAALARSTDELLGSQAKLMIGILDRKSSPLSVNPGFDRSTEGWWVVPESAGNVSWSADAGHNSVGALAVRGPEECVLEQRSKVPAGRFTALGFVKLEGEDSARVELDLSVMSRKRQFVNGYSVRVAPRPGEWTPIAESIDVIAELAANENSLYHMEKDELILATRLTVRELKKGSRIIVDDIGVYTWGQ